MKAHWRFPISLAILLNLAAGVGAAAAGATSYVARQADSRHVSAVFSVSGSHITAKDVALTCKKPGDALSGHGSGEIAAGRFEVRIGYEFYASRHSARPAHLWATLSGVLHGASISGSLSTSKPAPCSGGHFTAAVASAASPSPNGEAAGEENEGERSTEPGAPFGENGNYESAFNSEWEAKIEQICHTRIENGGEAGQPSVATSTCAAFLPPEAVTSQQAE
jgi:hypothetical protein